MERSHQYQLRRPLPGLSRPDAIEGVDLRQRQPIAANRVFELAVADDVVVLVARGARSSIARSARTSGKDRMSRSIALAAFGSTTSS
jgi:hypothetical protein